MEKIDPVHDPSAAWSVLHRFGQMGPTNGLGLFQVRQRTRHLEQAMGRPQRQREAFAGGFQPGLVGRCQQAMPAQAVEIEEGIGAALATLLQRAGLGHDSGDTGAGFATGLVIEHGILPGHRQVQVDAVEQGAGEFVAVALDLLGAAAAAAGGVAKIAAGAGVHRRHQLEACREAHPIPGPGDHDLARFQWLAQHFQHAPLELWQFIEKQHAMVCQGDFARLRAATAVRSNRKC